jgi:hypothetical protein
MKAAIIHFYTTLHKCSLNEKFLHFDVVLLMDTPTNNSCITSFGMPEEFKNIKTGIIGEGHASTNDFCI